MKNTRIISEIDYAFYQIITSCRFFFFLIIHIITISLLRPYTKGVVSVILKTHHYKHDKPVKCLILYGGIKYIKKTIRT